ncbi:hypothetical protein D7241_19740 [Stutzerimonas sp. VN223-3]|uniref:hypothetical protein n=1 Tax=Stutzerimonas sp. VN223-3 TaxID=3384601 RepID=UPI0038B5F8B7
MRETIATTLSPEEREALFDELEATLYHSHSLTVREHADETSSLTEAEDDRLHKTPEELEQELDRMCDELLAEHHHSLVRQLPNSQSEQSSQANAQVGPPSEDVPYERPSERGLIEVLFGGFVESEPVDEELEKDLAALDSLLDEAHARTEAHPEIAKLGAHEENEHSFLPVNASRPAEWGAFSSAETGEGQRPLAKKPSEPALAISGADAKNSRRRASYVKLSTAHKAGLLANFQSMREQNVVAISNLDPDLDHEQIAQIEARISFIVKVAQSYAGKGPGQLADWSKHVPADTKQFFRLLWLARQPNAVAVTIRLGHPTAKKALAAKRGPANHIAEVIQRTLAKLGISTDLGFNLEYTHGASAENHPLHLHGIVCIPADRLEAVRLALKSALAKEYRQRFDNLAVHIEAITNHRWWAGYCIKEHQLTADILKKVRGRSTVPDYACTSTRNGGRALHQGLEELLSGES